MKALSGKEMCKLLEENDWIFRKIEGSHHIYTKPGRRERLSVPVHGNQSFKKGLQHNMLKTANIEIT